MPKLHSARRGRRYALMVHSVAGTSFERAAFFSLRTWHGSGRPQGLVRGSAALRYSQASGRPLPSSLGAVPWTSLSETNPQRRDP